MDTPSPVGDDVAVVDGRDAAELSAPAYSPSVREVIPGLRRLFWVAGGLVLIVGTSLFFLPERTADNFAWTIATPLTATFLGAAYLAATVFEWATAREHVWARARVSVTPVLMFTVLTLLVTLRHLDRFHFGAEHRVITRVGTWLWMSIYLVVPVVMALLVLRQRRAPGTDPPRDRPLPGWLRATLGVQGTVLLVVGMALMLAPTQARWLWPWPLTALTGRAIAAWLLGIGVGMVHALIEGDLLRIRVAGVSNLAIASLQLAAIARYPDDVTSTPKAAVLVLFLVVMAGVGAAVVALTRRGSPALIHRTSAPQPSAQEFGGPSPVSAHEDAETNLDPGQSA